MGRPLPEGSSLIAVSVNSTGTPSTYVKDQEILNACGPCGVALRSVGGGGGPIEIKLLSM